MAPVYHRPERLVLASASPRRAELLARAGYPFDVAPPGIDERRRAGEAGRDYVARLAEEKAAAVAPRWPGRIVLAADTTVVVDSAVLGKPRDPGDAAGMLRRLSGRAHDVLTGVAVRRGEVRLRAVERTAVHFAALDEETISWYVATGEPSDKAGAYGVQGIASRFVTRIDGSCSNVAGLPLALVDRMLARLPAAAPPR